MSNTKKRIKKKKKPYLIRLMRKIKRTFKGWARRNPLRAQKLYIICVAFIIIIAAGIIFNMTGGREYIQKRVAKKTQVETTPETTLKKTMTPVVKSKPTKKPVTTKAPVKKKAVDTRKIYTYLQGPRSWKERRAWSGYWGDVYMDGGKFGAFGCGLCCMANIYSSITPVRYKASPVDMYRFAKKNTGYWGGSAIDWNFMVVGMRKAGIHCGPKRKPNKYSLFKKDIAASKCAVVLVSSYDSSCYWKHTPGHYVTIFAYDKTRDRVFLADSGDPTHNRQWISLKKVYRSLKMASRYQYVCVRGYSESKDTFKNKIARGKWVRPAYMKSKSVY